MSLDMHPLVADWLTVSDGRIILKSGKVDIGQRISTALARIVAGELTLDPDTIIVAPVSTATGPDEGITSGSNSIEQSGHALRRASATLRAAALARAAILLETDAPDLRDGLILDPASNRSLRLVDVATDLDPALAVDPDAPSLGIEPPPRPPRGMRAMTRGAHVFLHDITRPGMVHARTIRPPHRAARLRALAPETVAKLEGQGVRILRDGGFLAVAHPREYEAVRAAERLALACEWEGAQQEGDVFAMLRNRPRLSLRVEEGTPVDGPLPDPLTAPTLTATYERPYQLHGPLAPSAALAEWKAGHLDILSHSQGIHPLRDSMAEALSMDPAAITVTHAPGSGCYGHNGADDAAFEAALVAIALPDTPVLLKWSREDEHTWEPVAPAMAVDVAVRMEEGRITAWSQDTYSDTHRGRPRPGPDRAGPSRLAAARLRDPPEAPFVALPNRGRHAGIHRNLDPVYTIPDTRLTKHLVRDMPLRSSAMRCLGGAANTFAIESMMDALAIEAGADPLAFRRTHLADPRAHRILDTLAAHPAWRTPKTGGRGVAYGQYKNAMARVAILVDLHVTEAGAARLDRALIVADAGRIVDPDGLTAQMEGGFIQAASWCLHEEARFDRDGMVSRDWETYPVIRFDGIPRIETVLLPDPDAPSLGAGEAACGPAIAAIANALHDATGLRLHRLPFTPDRIRETALGP